MGAVVCGARRWLWCSIPHGWADCAYTVFLIAVCAVEEIQLGSAAAAAPLGDNWVPVCRPEDLPKGECFVIGSPTAPLVRPLLPSGAEDAIEP